MVVGIKPKSVRKCLGLGWRPFLELKKGTGLILLERPSNQHSVCASIFGGETRRPI